MSYFARGPESPKHVSCSRAKDAPVQVQVALEQETFWGFSSPRPKKTTCSFPYRDPNDFGKCNLALQFHPPVTGLLKWEIPGSALGSAFEGAPGNRGAPRSAPESAQRDWGCSRECSRECSMWGVNRKSTLTSTPWSTPNLPERRFHRTMEMIPALPW